MSDVLKNVNAALADVEIDLLHGTRKMAESDDKEAEDEGGEGDEDSEPDELVCPECDGDGCEDCDYAGFIDEE